MKIKIIIPSPEKIRGRLEERKRKTIDVIYEKLQEMLGGELLTEEELKRHPYARRRPRSLSPLVHIRTGRMRESLKKTENGVVWSSNKPPYVSYVLEGTSRMIPRDFIKAALEKAEPELRRIWS